MASPSAISEIFFQASLTPAAVLDGDQVIRSVNPAALAAWSTTQGAALGNTLWAVVIEAEALRQVLQESFDRVARSAAADAIEVPLYGGRRDGTHVEQKENAWQILNTPLAVSGEPNWILHQFQPLALARPGEDQEFQRLRASEQRFRLQVDAVKDYAIFMLDPGGNVASWNAGAERIKGYKVAEIVGQHFSRFYGAEDVRRNLPRLELETARAMGSYGGEGWRYRKDGSRFWANVVITSLIDDKGSLQGFTKITLDCTERRQSDETARALHAQLGRSLQDLRRENAELTALDLASQAISGDLAMDSVLQKIVDQARTLVDSLYGALAVTDSSGGVVSFVTSGTDEHEGITIGALPQERGLLGVTLHENQRLQLVDLTKAPHAKGFPPPHSPARSLLAIPLPCRGTFRGNLCLANRLGQVEFSAEDEQILTRFASTAAIAIDSADLHRRLRTLAVAEERVRIAHELHDGTAQVLAYVGVKAQAVRELLRVGRIDKAQSELDSLREAAADLQIQTRDAILGLRIQLDDQPLAASVRRIVENWQDQSGTPIELVIDDDLELHAEVKLALLRIVQEGLANVRKHARAQCARVELRRGDGSILLRIEDDGVGIADRQGDRALHFGLRTMRERAERIGGSLALESLPGQGTRLSVRLSATSLGQQAP
jgi:PAS domain S-box-containing protein